MNFLVTGATGFLGRPLLAAIEAAGHEWTGLSREAGGRARYFSWPDSAKLPPMEALNGRDVVVHLAGEPVAQRWSSEVKRRIRASRIDSTASLTEALSRMPRPPKTLVCASAIGFYGDRGDELLNEQSLPGSGFLPETCVAWEKEAARAAVLGIRVVLLRIGIVLGPGGGALAKMITPFRLGLGGPLASGRQWMSWIHRDDLVRMILWAAAHPSLKGPVNAVAPEPVRNSDFTSHLAAAVRRPAILPVPELSLKLLYGEMSSVLLASARVVPEVSQRHGFTCSFGSLRDALAASVLT
ncbi:MAG: TIGR01777 family oxidoreductase [Bryobacter sp.]|jgi:hypothetical protein|nr:TIGR01777 family oxidoreductase [Bryobacter sp.]